MLVFMCGSFYIVMESCDCGEILTECFSNIIIDVVIIIIVNLYYLSIKCYMFIT